MALPGFFGVTMMLLPLTLTVAMAGSLDAPVNRSGLSSEPIALTATVTGASPACARMMGPLCASAIRAGLSAALPLLTLTISVESSVR